MDSTKSGAGPSLSSLLLWGLERIITELQIVKKEGESERERKNCNTMLIFQRRGQRENEESEGDYGDRQILQEKYQGKERKRQRKNDS